MWALLLVVFVVAIWLLTRMGRPSGSASASSRTISSLPGRQVHQARGANDDSMRSVEVPVTGGPQTPGYRVPQRPHHRVALPEGRELTVEPSFESYDPGAGFLADAERFVSRTHPKVAQAPFLAYWSSYRDLSPEQARWYFYWRSEVRGGHFLPTDLSYLFIHVYECLHAIGFEDAGEAWEHLLDLWRRYREQHPKLDHYLQVWVLDMNAYYGLGREPLEVVRDMVRQGVRFQDPDLVAASWLEMRDYGALPPGMLDTIAGFDRRSGKFFREYPDPVLIERTLQLAFEAADVYFLTTTGRGIFETHAPAQARPIRRRAFSGAVFDYVSREVEIASVLPLSRSAQLSSLLQGILKYAENTLRKQVGFRGQRRGVELPEALEAYLRLVLGSTTSVPMAKPIERRTIHIDTAKIEALRRDSEDVRAQLELSEWSGDELYEVSIDPTPDPATGEGAVAGAAPTTSQARSTRFSIPPDTPPGLLTDVDKVASVLDNLVAVDLALLHELRAMEWELVDKDAPEAERIRAASEHVLGDSLVAHERDRIVVVDDYRDELEFLLIREEYAPPESASQPTDEASESSEHPVEGWSQLRRMMTPVQARALAMVVVGCTPDEMDRFAAEHRTMGALLLDSINERALDVIGDAIIDTYEDPLMIFDEHRVDVREHFGA